MIRLIYTNLHLFSGPKKSICCEVPSKPPKKGGIDPLRSDIAAVLNIRFTMTCPKKSSADTPRSNSHTEEPLRSTEELINRITASSCSSSRSLREPPRQQALRPYINRDIV